VGVSVFWVSVCICVCFFACGCVCGCMRVFASVCLYVYVCMCVRVFASIYMCVRVCIYQVWCLVAYGSRAVRYSEIKTTNNVNIAIVYKYATQM
jgi:hypothetical protein